jgi:hypothetical protein
MGNINDTTSLQIKTGSFAVKDDIDINALNTHDNCT